MVEEKLVGRYTLNGNRVYEARKKPISRSRTNSRKETNLRISDTSGSAEGQGGFLNDLCQ